ncbi:MAG: response regulator [Lachnospiraceae bacterium]|nr:response regulator [Lachnospiraceae bacterium]
MQKKGLVYVQDYIHALLDDGGSKINNLLIIRHNNNFQLTEAELQEMELELGSYQLVYHAFSENKVRESYEPFLDIIRDYVFEKCNNSSKIDVFLDKCNVYSLHRQLFKNYFTGEHLHRQEELLVGEYAYEKRKIMETVMQMLAYVTQKTGLLLIVDQMNIASTSFWNILLALQKGNLAARVKVLGIYNNLGESLECSKKIATDVLQRCQERDCCFDVFLEEKNKIEDERLERRVVENELDRLEKLIHMSFFLECETCMYYLKKYYNLHKYDSWNISLLYKRFILHLYFWASLGLEDYSYALLVCDLLEENLLKGSEVDDIKFDVICNKALVYMYSRNEVPMRTYIMACKEMADTYQNETMQFKTEMLTIMAEYYGWKDLWISEKSYDVSEDFIKKCEENGAWNHLAHIYVYCFDNAYSDLEEVNGIENKIPYFMKGIAIGKRLGNGHFLMEAYQKVILLSSIHSYFSTAIHFYWETMKIVRISKDSLREAGIYNGLGYSYCGMGQYELANQHYNKALRIYFNYGMVDEVVETLYNMGINGIVAGDYNNASECLLTANNILTELKMSTLRVCNIAKLFGLIALACFRAGIFHHAYLYLNNAKQFLNHIIEGGHMEDALYSEDSLFLYYYVRSLVCLKEGEVKLAYKSIKEAEVYMEHATGSKFLNYPQFVKTYYEICNKLGKKQEAEQYILVGIAYCKEQNFQYLEQKLRLIHGEEIPEEERIAKKTMKITSVSVREIVKWIRRVSFEKNSEEAKKNIRFLSVLHQYVDGMEGMDRFDNVVSMCKNNFCIDKMFIVEYKEDKFHVLYSDLGYKVSRKDLLHMQSFFEIERKGIVFSKNGQEYEDYDRVFGAFYKDRIYSFIAIPYIEDKQVVGMMVCYVEQRDSWTTSKEKTLLDEDDLTMFTYVYNQMIGSMIRLNAKKNLEKTNKQLLQQIHRATKLKNEAEQANAAKSNFLASMSHEIRTPMNAIIGMTEIVMRENMSDKQRENLEQIKAAGNSLLAIINDILDFSKIESGKMELKEIVYDTSNLIRDVKGILQNRVHEKNISFQIEVKGQIPQYLYGDDLRLRQMIINLGNNAIKFTEKGSVTIFFSCEEEDAQHVMLKVAVKDTGIGIRKSDQKKLFQSFQQVDTQNNRKIEGSGLGLAITKAFVEMMQGSIQLDSEYGKGSTFSFSVVQKKVDADKQLEDTKEENASIPFIAPEAKILVVDDNYINLRVLEGLLEPFSIQYITASSGQECLKKLEEDQTFDMIFMDHMMPGLDGIETLHLLREMEGEYYQNIPVVALTANAIMGVKEMFLQEGFQGYISKPIDMKEIKIALRKWIPKEKIQTDLVQENVGKNEIYEQCLQALEDFDITGIEELFPKLRELDWSEEEQRLLQQVKNHLDNIEYVEAENILKQLK